MTTKQRKTPWYIGCLVKLAIFIWLPLAGVVVGFWIGFDTARTSPEMSLPPLSALTSFIKTSTSTAQTSSGVRISVTSISRDGAALVVQFNLTNNSDKPFQDLPQDFFLLDNHGRRYEPEILSDFNLFRHLNPGISRSIRLIFEAPPGWYSFNYQDASIPLGTW